ncbi:MAG TPA: peptide-methionine (S)-S-oxide reductase MsrA [Candidatus Nanoarchaeia archaeon]|nr:peptide-methionine (S)-S-oxide reductase MsrA [Candidatus Nanoarchaeia archaeon]
MNEKATFGAGCFWHVEEQFSKVGGVIETTAGFMGGEKKDPTYEEVSTGKTGHAEAVQVEYDPSKIAYDDLLDIFWNIHNPTLLNQQGADVGTQYRSVIFYHSESQKRIALESKSRLPNASQVVTEIVPVGVFYSAEEYHQKYIKRRGLC